MKRKIIKIDESLCNGCGECVTGCHEGALQIINGKAKLVREDFCDGFGDCIGTCPTGALTIEEREADDFDVEAVRNHLRQTQGEEAVQKMDEAQKKHAPTVKEFKGCPGLANFTIKREEKKEAKQNNGAFSTNVVPSELAQWPVQLHLVNPASPFLADRELVIMSTCSPVACGDIQWKYIRGRSVVLACPKLDKTEPYVSKLTEIFKRTDLPKVIVLRMSVPCCGGLTMMAKEALAQCGRNDLVVEEHILSVEGNLDSINQL